MIKIAKLVSSEFVIGREEGSHLINVMGMRFASDPKTGSLGISIIPYMYPMLSTPARLITNDKIIYSEEAPQDVQIKYIDSLQKLVALLTGAMSNEPTKSNSRQNAVSVNNTKETEENSRTSDDDELRSIADISSK